MWACNFIPFLSIDNPRKSISCFSIIALFFEKAIDVGITQGTHKFSLLTKNTVAELLTRIKKK